MLFVASKIFGILFVPSSLLILLLSLGLICRLLGFLRTSRTLTCIATLALVALGFSPLNRIIARPLEDRFSIPPTPSVPPSGIIVLGGAIDPVISETRHSIAMSIGAGRMTTAAILALRYPSARIVFSGGSPNIFAPRSDEAAAAKQLLRDLGVHGDRIVLEDKSRNTYENATLTRDLVRRNSGDTWFLVTSAIHMPRAVGSFRKAGFDVIPYPSEYLTSGKTADFWSPRENVSNGLQLADIATHEWIGLFAYWVLGRTDALLPGMYSSPKG